MRKKVDAQQTLIVLKAKCVKWQQLLPQKKETILL
jgi:hypothetical protein